MKIFSFDTRNCMLWKSVQDYLNLDDRDCYDIINAEFENTKLLLKENKINYDVEEVINEYLESIEIEDRKKINIDFLKELINGVLDNINDDYVDLVLISHF